jgi:FMN phosphatase YigB (HAD superfamily)
MRSRKPDPRPYRQALLALGANAASAVFVGDHPVKDFIRANQLGMHTVRVFTGEFSKQDYPSREHAAQFEISSVARLPELLYPNEDHSSLLIDFNIGRHRSAG